MSVARTCLGCGSTFHVDFPSRRTRFCSRSCGASASASRRTGDQNSNWRGGRIQHPLYAAYLDMIARCTRQTHHAFPRYGGRGITVCDRWREDFWAFVADMGERPAGHSLDRINNDGPYSPDNCRWATDSEQSRNRRDAAYAGSHRDPSTGRFVPEADA